MFELADSDSDSAGCRQDYVAVRQKVLVIYGLSYELPKKGFELLDQ